jgi:UDP-N-acetylmuramoyl-tripeptide--D-alanyl-D-alanine ligase
LAILNLPSGYNSYKNWRPAIVGALEAILKTDFPKVLVLELGVSHPGDMKYLMSIIKPDISVITDITQRYLEGFSGMDDLTGEYEMLVGNTKTGGVIVFNGDNPRVRDIMKDASGLKKISFGKSSGVDWRIAEIIRGKTGEAVKIAHGSKMVELETGRFGEHHAYVSAAVQAVIGENIL